MLCFDVTFFISQFVVSSAHARVACLYYERHINKYTGLNEVVQNIGVKTREIVISCLILINNTSF